VTLPKALLLCATLGSVACHGSKPDPREITVGQLADLLKAERPPHIFDANGESARREYGVIPGATLLPSPSSYSLGLLPESKSDSLVFYCASSWCSAAECAARRAMEAGYSEVSVLPNGIKGWSGAGLRTASLH
jgi:rhodanese-related sulfurtransferase